MVTLNRLFGKHKMSEGKEVNKATERGCRRATPKLVTVLSMLAFVLLLTSVTPPPAGYAAFPGANGKIAFTSLRDGNLEIYVMNADGSEQTNLTNNPAVDVNPAWSSDGRKIAFMSDRDGNSEIYVMNADGSEQTRLTNNPAVDEKPAWSPDGTMIAFLRIEAFGISQIWVMNANGSGETQLTNDSLINSAPVWSPDGTMIAFVKAVFGGDADVWVMDADGSGATNLTPNSYQQDLDPDWSPDGTKLAFFRGGSGLSEIWVMNADGSGQTKLSTSSTVGDAMPVWSPDGAKIAFTSLRDGNAEIYVMDADGSGATNLSNNPASAFDHFPDWQPLPTISVEIDIKPGSNPNSWPCKKINDGLPVAILSNAGFDATMVDADNVRFGKTGTEAAEVHKKDGKAKRHVEDKNGDGLLDMVFHFRFGDTGFSCDDIPEGQTSVTLEAKLTGKANGAPIEGTDTLRLVKE